MNPLSMIRMTPPVEPLKPTGTSPASPQNPSQEFGQLFEQAVQRVEQAHRDGQEKVGRLLRGEDQELHEVLLATQRAELSFEYFLQVRNKVVQAYQEVMRMQM
ncbi:MAG: flagellar hook-basal body complex protein FliE [Bryobacterales bacterium]|nr:flagellar hook-basal body complex protein FliE [Bryobacterales bacterium]